MDFETIHKLLLQEKRSGILAKLEKQFYTECLEFYSAKLEMMEENYSSTARNELENSKRILKELISRRHQKIILKALNDVKGNSLNVDGLTSQEESFYTSLVDLINSHANEISMILDGKKKLAKPKLKILVEVPSFVGKKSDVLGPYSAGQEVELNREDASFLVEKNMAVLLS